MIRTAAFALVLVLCAPAVAGLVTISEVLYDASGSDNGKTFVELYGPAGLVLDGWYLEAINGAGGGTTLLLELSTLEIPADGFLVLADTSGGGTAVEHADGLFASLDPQNGPDSILIRQGSTVVDALGYGSFSVGDVFAGEGAPVAGVAPGMSLARIFADLDTDLNHLDFAPLAEPTPGAGPLSSIPVATPEPASLLLLGVGIALLALKARYSRKQ